MITVKTFGNYKRQNFEPKFCPYCGPDGSISADAYVEPDDENYDWLDEMG